MLISAIRKFFSELSGSFLVSENPIDNGNKTVSYRRKSLVINFIGIFLIILMLLLGLFSALTGSYTRAAIDAVAATVISLLLLYLKKTRNYPLAARAIVTFCLLFAMHLFQAEISGEGLYLWALTAPMFLIFFLKLREGMILALVYYAANILLVAFDLFNTEYSVRFLIRYSAVYITLVVMSYIYGRIQEATTGRLISLNRDLNETIRKLSLTTKDLETSEERYRALVENSTDGIGILREFRFIYINQKLCNMSGYAQDDLIGKSLDEILITGSSDMLKRLFDTETRSGLPRSRIELQLKTAAGEMIEVEVGTNTIEHQRSRTQLIFIRDVRDRNLIEQERAKISKLESFRMVANGVTHDFNNILTIILGNLELIKLNAAGNQKLEKPVKKIEEASGRASELLEDLYIFSTSSIKEESLEDIGEIFESVINPIIIEFPETRFNVRLADGLWKLKCDRKQTRIALKNIITNSVEATDGKGEINISVSNYLNQGRTVQALRDTGYIKISIRDYGRGILTENLNKVFDPYFSTKGNVTEKGVGLGLAIANKIILDHRGLITVDSGEGKGATFNIYFPAETDPAPTNR